MPPWPLQVTKHCSNSVHTWDSLPGPPALLAPVLTGVCQNCADSLKKVEEDATLRGVAVFSARNAQLPLYNFPSTSRIDLLNMEVRALFAQASIVESMLVALNHMQVNVCTFEKSRGFPHERILFRFRRDCPNYSNTSASSRQ